MAELANLETMNCEELLKELSILTAARDHHDAATTFPAESPETEIDATHLAAQQDSKARIDRIGELIKAKGCA